MPRSPEAAPIAAHRFITPTRTHADAGRAAPTAAASPPPRLALHRLRNGPVQQAAPRQPVRGGSINARINHLFERVRQQERGLHVAPPEVTACTRLPVPTGATAQFVRVGNNAVDCLIKLLGTPGAGRVAIINPADSRHRGGGLGVEWFNHQRMPAEEALCVLGRGAKASLDVATGYPLGLEHAGERQLYSPGVQLRHDRSVLHALCDVRGTPGERLEAQRDLLLGASFAAPSSTGSSYDMISIAALDRRGQPDFDAKALYAGMLRQFAHAMANAARHEVDTFILLLPGSGLFSRTSRAQDAAVDPLYQHALACAAVDAVRLFSKGLQRVVIPSHGPALDALIDAYSKQPLHLAQAVVPGGPRRSPPPAGAPAPQPRPVPRMSPVQVNGHAQPRAPVVALKMPVTPRQMGGLAYQVRPENLARNPRAAVTQALKPLIGDGSKVTLRRVHGVPAPAQGSQPYWFIRRDPDPTIGRALVSVQVAPGQRQVFEVVYSPRALPQLAAMAARAPTG